MTSPDILDAATRWHAAGATPLPVAPDGSKRPAVTTWTNLQKQRPTWNETLAIFQRTDSDGIGIICGNVSARLEMLETEGRAVAEGILQGLAQAMAGHDLTDLWNRIQNGCMEVTPSGGIHWYLRVSDGPSRRNTKLARRPATPEELATHQAAERAKLDTITDEQLRARRAAKIDTLTPADVPQVLIETRGEGGWSVVAPSAGRSHPTGKAWILVAGGPDTIPTITCEERDAIYAVAGTLDEMPTPAPAPQPTPSAAPIPAPDAAGTGLRPGDDYNNRATWDDILIPHGWQPVTGRPGGERHWVRPGKNRGDGISATTGHADDADRLYVFSSSAAPFDADRPYDKFGAYALLEHNGDLAAATKALAAAGYGDQDNTGPRLTLDGRPAALADITTSGPQERAGAAEESFWATRPVLAHIRSFALARLAAPYAVLGTLLLDALQSVPVAFVLPPVIGGDGSVNAFLNLVGRSGSGKGAARGAADDCLTGIPTPYRVTIGSGEGIGHQYGKHDKNGFQMVRNAVLFETPEIDAVAAISARQGSTLMDQLRKAYSGEPLGFAYANQEKRLLIQAHTYRFGFVAGVQPEKSSALLADADGGTPQRFLWLPVVDKNITADPIDCPEPFRVTMPIWDPRRARKTAKGRSIIEIPDEVEQSIRQARVDTARGNVDALDGHRLFTQEKIAVAFAVLDGRACVSLEDWALAEHLMSISDRTRAHCVAVLQTKSRESLQGRVLARAKAEENARESVAESSIQTIADSIRRSLKNGPKGRSDLRRRINSVKRPYFDDAMEEMVGAGEVVIEESERGAIVTLINRGGGHPATPPPLPPSTGVARDATPAGGGA